jgi:hypothetical protein
MRTIKLTEGQAVQVRDAIMAGNPVFYVFAPDRRMRRSLYAKGLTDRDGAMPRLTEDGKDVARQLKDNPRKRTFHIAEAADRRVWRVQPSEYVDQVIDGHEMTKQPWPYFVANDGAVIKHGFGDPPRPVRAVGFQRDLAEAAIDLFWGAAVAEPEAAVGMYLVTAEGDTWSTEMTAVESMAVEGAERPGEE